VIPKDPRFGWELMFSIRSLYQNIKEDFDITIIGEIPSWIDTTQVLCISYDNSHKFDCPYKRVTDKIVLASNLYDDFILIHDDMYIMENVDIQEIKKYRYLEKPHTQDFVIHDKMTAYQKAHFTTLALTKELSNNKFMYNFATHTPFYYESKNIKLLQNKTDLTKNGLVFENIYYNYFYDKDPILLEKDYRCGIYTREDIDTSLNYKLLSHNEQGYLYHPQILKLLSSKFYNKCIVEK
jgi:hypothetical protein